MTNAERQRAYRQRVKASGAMVVRVAVYRANRKRFEALRAKHGGTDAAVNALIELSTD